MVFESVVAEVLNRFLGDYVENLNRNQLQIGILGGDVVLENLILKENALDELDLPVQVVYGHLGKLVLKIPWHNLYKASVEVTIESLYVIANPLSEIVYNAERDEKNKQLKKMSELNRIEEAKKKEAQKDNEKVDDSFVEKLVAQVIKNVQLTIKNIHIRYEDTVTNPTSPFACGVTLYNLAVQTTDNNWIPTVVKEAVTKIYKVLTLEGLALYWNSSADILSKKESGEIQRIMMEEIATKTSKPNNYSYFLGPINATSKLKLNPKPEADEPKFSIPKVILSLNMEQLLVAINRDQYQTMMKLADSMTVMAKAAPYRKYRPKVPTYRGYYKEWWQFAYTCILEEEVKRKRRNWDWEHMRTHRHTCSEYAEAYRCKLSQKKVGNDTLEKIENCEVKLDLFNLVIIRQRIELEVERLGKEAEEEKKGWFSSWWGGSAKQQAADENEAIIKKLENAMTPEEKSKLFRAIDYHENSAPLHMPIEYEAIQCHFQLDSLSLSVNEDKLTVILATVDKVSLDFNQRPSAQAIRVDMKMSDFYVNGLRQGDYTPRLASRRAISESDALLVVSFETNPLGKKCDQCVRVRAEALQAVYDAQTVIHIVDIFAVDDEKASAVERLQLAAVNQLSNLKEKSALGMQYAVEKHTFIEVDIEIASSYVIMSQGGIYKEQEPCMVVNLGSISVKSQPRSDKALDVSNMFREGLCDEEIFKQLMEHTYDKFQIKLNDMQVVVASRDEDWLEAISKGDQVTPLHLLQPTTLTIDIHKCLLIDEPRLPKVKVVGQLQKLALNVFESRLLSFLGILVSIPLPKSKTAPPPLKHGESRGSNLSLRKYLEGAEVKRKEKSREIDEETIQLTEVEAFFILNELMLEVASEKEEALVFTLNNLELTATKKTYTLEAGVRLGSVSLLHLQPSHDAIQIIGTPEIMASEGETVNPYLFLINFVEADRHGPDFRSKHKSVEKLIILDFTTLKILLHLESLKKILFMATEYQRKINEVQGERDRVGSTVGLLEMIPEDEELVVTKSKSSAQAKDKEKPTKKKKIETIQLKVDVKIGAIDLQFCTRVRGLADAFVHDMRAGLMVKDSYTQIDISVGDIRVLDRNPLSEYKEILGVIGDNVMNIRVVTYNIEKYPHISTSNMSIDAQLNCVKIVFLNWFVTSMLDFLNNFQAAQQAIIEASKQTADAAKANMQNAYENQTKIALNIKMSAPIILVPESSRSLNVIWLDLGEINLNNRFCDTPIEDSDKLVTTDQLTLSMENMKLACVRLVPNSDAFTEESVMLKPTNFTLDVKRNLSLWYVALPDVEISGKLDTIEISLSDSDMQRIVSVLEGNLQEGKADANELAQTQKSQAQTKTKTSGKSSNVDTKESLVSLSPNMKEVPHTTVKFSFMLESFIINLEESLQSSVKSKKPCMSGLAKLCFNLLCVRGRILSDNSIHTSVRLLDCTLDDMRPHRAAKITRYLERKHEQNADSRTEDLVVLGKMDEHIRSMIDITYTMKNADSFIDVRVFSFNLILAMDFLLRLSEFVKGTPKTPSKASSDLSSQQTPKKKAVQVQDAQQDKPVAMMTISLKVEKPDIILVESFDDKDCEALILNTEILYKMRSREDRTVMDGSIASLQLYRRSEGKMSNFVLEPCNLSLAVAQPDNCGMNVDLAISDIKLNITQDTIGLLNRVFATLLRKDDQNVEDVKEAIEYDDLWAVKPFTPTAYWFMRTEEGKEAFELEQSTSSVGSGSKRIGNEICMAGCPSITISLQVGYGDNALPLLAINTSLRAQIKDWSSELNVEASMTLLVSYYNITKALWEPLLEPVEVLKDNKYKHVPWELKIDVMMNQSEDNIDASSADVEAQSKALAEQKAPMDITVSSDHTMELTMTYTCMNVLTDLSSTYLAAIASNEVTTASPTSKFINNKQIYTKAPYVVHNCTGRNIKLILDEKSDFQLYSSNNKSEEILIREVVMEQECQVDLQLRRGGMSQVKLHEATPSYKLKLSVDDDDCLTIPVEKADKRYFLLKQHISNGTDDKTVDHPQEKPAIISEVVWQNGSIHLYLSSCVKITNELSVPVTIFYMTKNGGEIETIKNVMPNETIRLPLQAVHTSYGELYFSVEDYRVTDAPFIWRDLRYEHNLSKLFECESKSEELKSKFYIRVVGLTDQVLFEGTESRSLNSQAFTLTIKPAMTLQNCLPVPLTLNMKSGLKKLAAGELMQLNNCYPYNDLLTLVLDEYQEKCWSCASKIPDKESELSVWSFDSHDSPEKITMELGMHSVNVGGTQMLSLYCPFWMLNKTGLTLSYRKSKKMDKKKRSPSKADYDGSNVLFHPADQQDPILFSFRAKNFFGKKKASVRVDFGDWSEKFSLDLAGAAGVVICKTENKMYTLSIENQLTFNSLTKMVIFKPFFILINDAPFAIEYQEMHRSADPWVKVEAGCSEPLWPATERFEKLMVLRVAGSNDNAAPFSYTSQHTATLKLKDHHGGLNVETQISEKGSYITVRQYQPDTAPALIMNNTELPLTFYEKENVNVRRLQSGHKVLYTWENPAGPRVLVFECAKKKDFENDLRRDGFGEFTLSDGSEAFWASFLEGHQRIIFLTSDRELAECAITRGKVGKILTDFKLSIHAVGFSFVDDIRAVEIMYLSISSSGIIWEACKMNGRRYKKVSERKVELLEESYQKYLNECAVTKKVLPGIVQIDTKTQVDFAQKIQLKPTAKILRRISESGVYVWLGLYENSRRFHMKLHKIQIDQHVPGSAFPVVLAAVPLPKSVAAQHEAKPFVEISIIERIMPHTTVKQFNYFRVLIQEFHIKIDMTFINAIMAMFPPKTISEEEALKLFTTDLANARKSLYELAALGAANYHKDFYDNLHLSPIKVHISFSLGGATQLPTFIGTILQGIGVTLTDMNDVVLKLGYYEREFEFLSQSELQSQVQAHYTSQALRQLYVLVLGLDVLGNPYGLVLGLKKGVEDLFYEPFQGLIQGPSEFAEGLALGVRSLAGHVVGGAAGAVAKITGAVGSGLAALSMDKDYQAARRTTRATRPATLQEGLARSGRGLVMGVFDGVTGVFTKPVSGAKSGGVEGFFKGLGQGAAGLVARPTAGVVDFASGSFDAVKRVTELSDEVNQTRVHRILNKDAGVKPYSKTKAAGNKLLKELDKGKFALTDKYVCHVYCPGEKEGLLCTDKRMIYFEMSSVFGQNQIEWTFLWSEIPSAPVIVDKGIFIPLPQKKMFGMFNHSNNGKIINIIDDAKRKYVFTKCQECFNANR